MGLLCRGPCSVDAPGKIALFYRVDLGEKGAWVTGRTGGVGGGETVVGTAWEKKKYFLKN